MARYKLRFRKSVAKDFRSIPDQYVPRILERIQSLQDNPRPAGCEKLSGQERYRIRQGAYRILYEIENGQLVITVVKVAHRKHVYRYKN